MISCDDFPNDPSNIHANLYKVLLLARSGCTDTMPSVSYTISLPSRNRSGHRGSVAYAPNNPSAGNFSPDEFCNLARTFRVPRWGRTIAVLKRLYAWRSSNAFASCEIT